MAEAFAQIEDPNFEQIRDEFCRQLSRAAAGDTTSLPFIHNHLPSTPLVKLGETFQSMVIGGTNGQAATLCYNDDSTIEIVEQHAYPELAKFRTVDDFLAFFEANVTESTAALGINFGVNLVPVVGDQGQLDGILNEGTTKGHSFEGLQKQRVGQTIEDYFRDKHKRNLIVSVANDTVCLLASGTNKKSDRANLVAGIVGTGYNMAMYLDEYTIINLQASDFTGFTPTASGKLVDMTSSNVGEQLYDKEVSKLFMHYNAFVGEMGLSGSNLASGTELANLAASNPHAEGDVARALLRRSAAFVAAQFAGMYNFKNRPQQLTAIMQGGLYWSGPQYKEMVGTQLSLLGVPEGAIRFVKIDNCDILGAAMLLTGGL